MKNTGKYMENSLKSKKIFIRSNEGEIVGQHWVTENGEKGILVKKKGFVPYKALLPLMAS